MAPMLAAGFYEGWYRHECWYWWYVARVEILESILGGICAGGTDGRFLNVACGTGMTSERFRRFGRVIGLDHASEALSFCAARGLEHLVRADASRLPFAAGSFRVVAACDILEHLHEDQPLLDECARVLERGGWLLVTVPALDLFWTSNDDAQHQRRYSATGLARRIARAGLRLERMTYFNSLLLPLFPIHLARQWFLTGPVTSGTFIPSIPSPANRLLYRVFRWERALLRWLDLPIGISLLAVARRA